MKTTQYTLKVNIKKNLTIAHLSDLHSKAPKGLLSEVERLSPDIIAISGDFVDCGIVGKYPHMLTLLEELAKIAPTFYSGGNHELFGKEDIDAVNKTGVTFLDDSFVSFGELVIGGLSSGFGFGKQGKFKKTPKPNTDFLDSFSRLDSTKILLCHHPEYYPEHLRERNIDVILAGHAHGGQWRFFGRGVFAPSQGLFPKYTSGVHDNRLVISRGLGNHTIIPRIFNPCELVAVRLEAL